MNVRNSGRTDTLRALILVSSALAAIATAPCAYAQVTDDPAEEESAIVVTGSVFQSRKDIESRRDSLVVVDTLSQDDIGSLPDRTIADSLRRITGVSTLNNDDIGQFVSVRGVNPDLIPVTFDGITLATIGDTGGGRRQVNLQVIPARAVQQIQAYKSFTPDLESGAMGGLINLLPSSAFDFSGQHLVVDVSTNYSSYGLVDDVNSAGGKKDSKFGSGAELSYASRFGPDGKFGIVVNAIWQQRQKDQSNDTTPGPLYLTDANTTTNTDDPAWNGVGIPSQYVTYGYTNRYRTYGGSLMLEFKPHDNFYTSLFGFGYFNNESETRNQTRLLGFDQIIQTSPTTGSLRVKSADTEWRHNTFERNSKGVAWHSRYDSEGSGVVDFRAGYTYANFHNIQPSALYLYTPNKRLTYDLNGAEHYVLDDAASYLNPANFKLSAAADTVMDAFQDVADSRIDYAFNSAAGDRGLGFQAGAAYRHLFNRTDKDFKRYASNGSTLAGYSVVPDYDLIGSPYPVLWIDQQKFRDSVLPLLAVNAATTARDSATSDYEYGENVANLYGAVTFATDNLRLVGGLRYDRTRTKASAPQILGGVLQPNDQTTHGKYDKLLPSLNGLYRIDSDVRVKFGYSRTLGRPNPSDIAQVETIDDANFIVSRGNPNLRPRVSDNFELGLEHFFNNGNGMLTLGVFAKDVKGDIITTQHEEDRGGQPYMITEPLNGDKTTFRGAEIGFVDSKLGFLPGPLANLGVSANALYVSGRSVYTQNGVRKTRDALLNQMQWSGNAALFYNVEDRGELRLAVNYQSEYIDTLGDSPWLDVGYGANTTLDLTARYDISKHWGARFEARNLLNANRERLAGLNLAYRRADIEFGSLFFLHLTYTN